MGRLAFPNTDRDHAVHSFANRDSIVESLKQPYDEKIQDVLDRHEYSFVLCDPKLPDHPIVYASKGFLSLSGYSAHEVLGRNCRFLQGGDSDKHAILEIRKAIREERSCQVRILNYTNQGKAFWNMLHLAPLFCPRDGTVIHFVGLQNPVSLSFEGKHEDDVMILSDSMTKTIIPEPKDHSIARRTGSNITRGSNAEFQIGGHIMSEINGSNCQCRGVNEIDGCEDNGENKCKAATALKSIISDLTQSSMRKSEVAGLRFMCSAEARGYLSPPLVLSLSSIHQSFVLADPNLPDMPIVHASDMFLHLTGYSREEVVGRNCRFLQGPDTDVKTVQKIRESIKESRPCTVRILNYRKNKQPFWNLLYIAPVRNGDGKVAYLVGVQLDLTAVGIRTFQTDTISAHMKQLGAVGAIRVAVRGLHGRGLCRSLEVPFP